ncbi:hypothetical protein BDQ17DRAFT_1364621 [Cyathus striatus]|nr:hypothetical protein BDQ17DRAFT_1364621 [Cyathus striatus]
MAHPHPLLTFPDPPTTDTISEARRALQQTRESVHALSTKITNEENALARILIDSQKQIDELKKQKEDLLRKEEETLAYLSLIRRMPPELLRMVFLCVFEEVPCFCWTVASTPRLWSRIRLLTSQHASPDVIRLWLERSGPTEPLDIEIFLHVHPSESELDPLLPRRRNSIPFSPPWFPIQNPYIQPIAPPQGITILPPATSVSVPSLSGDAADGERSQNRSLSWGYIVFYYLVDQMARWRRFVFKFDKHFSSLNALRNVTGDAPLLEEFEVSCLDTAFFPTEWSWFPSCPAAAGTPTPFPNLHHLTLHQAPFKTTSPIFQNLHSLSLRPLANVHCPLDRILNMIARNTTLQELKLTFHSASHPILPLHPVTLPELKKLSVGGHHLLSTLLSHLTLPNLTYLTLDIENREPVDDILSALLLRSSRPQLEYLSLSYGDMNPSAPYYASSSPIISWSAFLGEFAEVREMKVGGVPMDGLVSALCEPDEESNPVQAWLIPKLEVLSLRNCHVHGEGPGRLVQAVSDRNPTPLSQGGTNGGGGGPVRLRKLEVVECVNVNEDVIEWLRERIEDVIFVDNVDEPRSPYLS